ncbi:hypothetical protein N7490_010672 [Penicillium lividum]|nr:hypothetical protein N7490_010672 [Penicillium lividum]
MVSNFDDLRRTLADTEIYLPGESGYEESSKRWSALCIKPAAIVSTAFFHWPFVVVGIPPAGISASYGGMVIDLFKMRFTAVDLQKETIAFGGGCTWEDVNGALWDHGLGTVSGVVGDTGGLALDCLLSCEMVLANGDENADLFWALHWAGPNFGIVTKFTSQAYPQGECWAGFLAYPTEKLGELIEFGNRFIPCCQSLWATFFTPDRAAGLLAAVFYNGAEEEGKEFFKPIYDLGPIGDTTTTMPYTEVNMMFNKHPRTLKDRHLFGGSNFSLPLNVRDGLEIAEHFWRTTRLLKNEPLKGSTLTFEYHSTHQIRQVAVEETAFGNRGQFSSIFIIMNWTDETRDADARSMSGWFSQYIAARLATRAISIVMVRAVMRIISVSYNSLKTI